MGIHMVVIPSTIPEYVEKAARERSLRRPAVIVSPSGIAYRITSDGGSYRNRDGGALNTMMVSDIRHGNAHLYPGWRVGKHIELDEVAHYSQWPPKRS